MHQLLKRCLFFFQDVFVTYSLDSAAMSDKKKQVHIVLMCRELEGLSSLYVLSLL
jgi:hypothetical protein